LEEVAVAHLRQLLQTGMDGCINSFHVANIRKKLQIQPFSAEKIY
jgi:hypothetical protein